MEVRQDLPIVPFATPGDWERWLEENGSTSPGLWLKLAKKDTGIATISYAQALDTALCFGWIDGQKGAYDGQYFLQRFTPRGRRSRWSRINRDKAEALIAQGRMRPAGLEQVERAQADGRWEAAYEPQRTASVPEDLQRELERNPEAQAFFATLNGANRYAILYRIAEARKPETRARRIEKYVAMLGEHTTLYP